MKLKKTIYICLLGCAVVLSGCIDDTLYLEEGLQDNDRVAFSTFAMRGGLSASTRSGDREPYSPLILSEEGGAPALYLHTYKTDKIGFRPGEDINEEGVTRGVQISSADELKRYHESFKVTADIEGGGRYFDWTDASPISDLNRWYPAGREYWPADNQLSFHAVSPSSEFSRLGSLSAADGVISFDYDLPKGDAGRDAEAQTDLLVASTACNKKGSVDGAAPLEFHHTLSAVKFAIRDVANGEIERISISGVYGSGHCRFRETDGVKEVIWTDLKSKQTYTQDFNYEVKLPGAVDSSDDTADIILTDGMPEKTFMMIPQNIPDDAEISVTLRRAGMTPERITVKGKIKANLVEEWLAGYEYVYTISTSSSNWIYEFYAYGNRNSATGAYGVKTGDQIYAYAPSYAILDAEGRVQSYPYDTYGDEAYFYVRSFRYHANDPSKIEKVKWKATHGDAKQYRVPGSGGDIYVSGRDIPAEEWIADRSVLSGAGSYASSGQKKTFTFASPHQITDWPGDIWMQDQTAYSGNSQANPWDLSTCGGRLTRNTANSYVIDREGWYAIPLVFGNAIKNGKVNTTAYTYGGTADSTHINMVDYNGNAISGAWIPVASSYSASVVWADVFNTVSDVEIRKINGENMIVFQANKFNMQQGSVVIALYDGANAVWSWHIWITEHWLDPSTGQPNVYKSDGSFASFTKSSKGWRMRGDLLIDNSHVAKSYGYYVAPYNLGWCDPKDVDYLRRPSVMEFTQYAPDGTPTGKTASLKILQDGQRVSYLYGNNTYYQWGRKDPIVGFVDHSQTVKRNYGEKKYALQKSASGVDIQTGIRNPQVMYYQSQEWTNKTYVNLWNNSKSVTSPVKTVYDPCPPGYMVPPAYFFRFVGTDNKGSYYNISSNNTSLKNFNGTEVDAYTFKAASVDKSKQTDENSVWLTSTGNRWYTDNTVINGKTFNGGDNFNPQIVYLWASDQGSNYVYEGESLALGLDKNDAGGNNAYVICSYFKGRKTMARPVRPIREL